MLLTVICRANYQKIFPFRDKSAGFVYQVTVFCGVAAHTVLCYLRTLRQGGQICRNTVPIEMLFAVYLTITIQGIEEIGAICIRFYRVRSKVFIQLPSVPYLEITAERD